MCDQPVQQERPPVTTHPGSCDADDLAVAGIGFWNWDTRSDLVTWSDELFRICGLEPQSAPVTYDSYLETVHPGERDMVRATIAHSCRTGQSFSIDHRIVRPDGGRTYLEQMLSGRIPSYRVEKRFRRSDGQIVPAVPGVSLVLGRGGSPLHLIYQFEAVVQRLADESPEPDPGTGEGGRTAATHQVAATRSA